MNETVDLNCSDVKSNAEATRKKNLCFILKIHDHEKYTFLQSAALARTVLSVEIYVVTVVTVIGVIT